MDCSHLLSLVLALVFLTMSVCIYADDDVEDFKLYDNINASEVRAFSFNSLDEHGRVPVSNP